MIIINDIMILICNCLFNDSYNVFYMLNVLIFFVIDYGIKLIEVE